HSRTHRRMPMPYRLCHLSGQNGVRSTDLIDRDDEILARLNQRFSERIGRTLSLPDERSSNLACPDAGRRRVESLDTRSQGLPYIRRIEFPRRIQTEAEIVEALDHLTSRAGEVQSPASTQGL
ncbi:hypothetical protein, partial [Aureimonas pseudogalii]